MKSITFPIKISGKWEWIMTSNPQLINLFGLAIVSHFFITSYISVFSNY